MKLSCPFSRKPFVQILSVAIFSISGSHLSFADTVDLGTVGGTSGSVAGSTASIRAEKGTAAAVAPTQANLSATQPQSFISREYIEQSTPPTGNFNTITGIAPSVATTPAVNGPGLSDQKMSLRGFADGEYNVTFDGIPFGDTNGPTHHSTAYFPATVIGGMVIERGPGNASNIGFSTYGGSVNILSKAPSQTPSQSVYGSIGTWGTQLEGASYESGRMAGSDATLQLNLQHMQSNGYLTGSGINLNNFTLKYQRPVGDNTLLTLFASPAQVTTYTTDNANGATSAQIAAFGKNYAMNNNVNSQGYAGYNVQGKTSDMEYVRLQSDWGQGLQTDNQSYTYAYTNNTIAGQDPSLYTVKGDSSLSLTNIAKAKVNLPAGDVPGYLKLNEFRVYGDVLKVTRKIDKDLLRMGVWWEFSRTERHNFEADLTLGGAQLAGSPGYPTGIVTTTNFTQQYSHWHQYQPFIEYEWAAAPGLTITPGYKYMMYTMDLGSAVNQKALAPQYYSYKYQASLPFLTVNKRLNDQNSVYAQYATGMEMPPTFGVGNSNTSAPIPQTTTNYQVGFVHKEDSLIMDADLYYIDMSNMQQNTGTNANPNFVAAGGGIYKGIEGEATYLVGSGFSAYGNFSVNSANYKSSNASNPLTASFVGQIANAPNVTTAVGALYNMGPWNASLMFKRIGNQYNAKLGAQLPYIDNTDLNVSYNFKEVSSLGAKNFKLQFSIFNLTDRQNLVAASGPMGASSTQYLFQAPRSFMLSGKADF